MRIASFCLFLVLTGCAPKPQALYQNPLFPKCGPDPWALFYNGNYYYMHTMQNCLCLWVTPDITDVRNAPCKTIWTPEELELLNQARAAKAKADAQARREQELATYKALVDDAIRETVPEACAISEILATKKRAIIDRFRAVIRMKEELFRGTKALRDGRYTDTFTNADGTARVTVGYNTLDNYDDTYTSGVEMVNQYIESLATDAKSVQLANMVTTLLRERSKAGQLKAQNVLRLEQMAGESGNETFIEGMRIIREAYRPIQSKQFVKVELKDPVSNEWVPVSMNMTNC